MRISKARTTSKALTTNGQTTPHDIYTYMFTITYTKAERAMFEIFLRTKYLFLFGISVNNNILIADTQATLKYDIDLSKFSPSALEEQKPKSNVAFDAWLDQLAEFMTSKKEIISLQDQINTLLSENEMNANLIAKHANKISILRAFLTELGSLIDTLENRGLIKTKEIPNSYREARKLLKETLLQSIT